MGYHIGVATSTPAHGTRQGYAWHLRHDRPACQECRKANAKYSRRRRHAAERITR